MFDDEDIRILKHFLKLDKPKTGWEVMRFLCKKGNTGDNNRIYYKLKRMSKLGLFSMTKNSPMTFIINTNNVFQKRILIRTKKKECLFLLIDGKYQIFEV